MMATIVYETEIGVGVRWLTRVRFAPSDFQIKKSVISSFIIYFPQGVYS